MVRRFPVLFGCCLLAACASAPKPAPEPAPKAAAEPPAPEPPTLPPTEPLPILLSAGNPERDAFAILERIESGNPAVGMMRAGWRALLAARVGNALAMGVDAHGPVMIGVGETADEQLPVVGAARLLPNARKAIEREFTLDPMGPLSVLLPDPHAHGPVGRDVHCALITVAESELIACAEREDWLLRHGPWVAEQAATATDDAALRLEARGKLLQDPDKALMPQLDSEAARAGYLSTLELFASMRDFVAELRVAEGGYELSAEFELRPVEDSLAKLLVARPPGPELLPPAFEQLPPDATMALTSRGVHPDDMKAVADRFWSMALAAMGESRPDPRWAELVGHARRTFMRGGPFVVAYGHDTEAALSAVRRERSRKKPKRARIDAALSDYWIAGMRESYGAVVESLGGLLELERREEPKAGPQPSLEKIRLRKREGLPVGSLALRFERPGKNGTPGSQRFFVFASRTQPDGEWVWMATSRDRDLAVARLRGVLKGERRAPEERLLLLRPPGARDAVAFGFVTPAAMISLGLPREDTPDALDEAHMALEELAARSDEGQSAASFSYSHRPAEDGYRKARAVLYVPDAVLQAVPAPEAGALAPTE
ncbi:MAG: hypothetical protein PVI30_12205 [Myxococcales bacterium]|jgi:hypothetical protein